MSSIPGLKLYVSWIFVDKLSARILSIVLKLSMPFMHFDKHYVSVFVQYRNILICGSKRHIK